LQNTLAEPLQKFFEASVEAEEAEPSEESSERSLAPSDQRTDEAAP